MNLIISPQNRAQFHPLEAECCRSTCSCTVVTRQRSYSETTGRCLWNVSVEVRFCVRWEKRVDAQIHCLVFTSRCNMLAVSCSGLWNRLLWVVLRVVVSFLQSGNFYVACLLCVEQLRDARTLNYTFDVSRVSHTSSHVHGFDFQLSSKPVC